MYPENPEGTQVILGSMNMGYISGTARNRTHNLFRPKRELIPLDHSDGRVGTRRSRLNILTDNVEQCSAGNETIAHLVQTHRSFSLERLVPARQIISLY